MTIRLAILTVSDSGSRGRRRDESGDAIAAWASARGDEVVVRTIVPDEMDAIAEQFIIWIDDVGPDLILTTGGTGLSPTDVTPEATDAILGRRAPGISELIRAAGIAKNPRAALSRGVAGVRGQTLIINLPGSTPAVLDVLAALDPIIEHAVDLATGRRTGHCWRRSSSRWMISNPPSGPTRRWRRRATRPRWSPRWTMSAPRSGASTRT